MILNKVKLVPKNPISEEVKSESGEGFKYAILYKPNNAVVALFDGKYWAQHFVESTNIADSFEIREVAND